MNSEKYVTTLGDFGEKEWLNALDGLATNIHEVDRIPTQIWFRFYPLALHKHLRGAEDLETTLQGFAMQGKYSLKDQIDVSHGFLYGHRYWPKVKAAILSRAGSFDDDDLDLSKEISLVAEKASESTNSGTDLTTGISAIGMMTLAQVGLAAFESSKGVTVRPQGLLKMSPSKILQKRSEDKKQGFLSFLKTVDKEFHVTWDETKAGAKFDIIFDEEIASGAARDQSQNWLEMDERCGEGVIPVECRSAACGTCWIGVVAGAEKLSDVAPLERKQMRVFGYRQGDDAKPFMRLACQARAEGSVSIVIPPWNGVFGKKVYDNVEKIDLEPATTSAVKLRETIEEVLSDGDKPN